MYVGPYIEFYSNIKIFKTENCKETNCSFRDGENFCHQCGLDAKSRYEYMFNINSYIDELESDYKFNLILQDTIEKNNLTILRCKKIPKDIKEISTLDKKICCKLIMYDEDLLESSHNIESINPETPSRDIEKLKFTYKEEITKLEAIFGKNNISIKYGIIFY